MVVKLYIFASDKREPTWWQNFRRSLDSNAWPGAELEKLYKAKFVPYSNDGINYISPHIEFETDEECTAFLLRWS
jgi:hypothetical protein